VKSHNASFILYWSFSRFQSTDANWQEKSVEMENLSPFGYLMELINQMSKDQACFTIINLRNLLEIWPEKITEQMGVIDRTAPSPIHRISTLY
jgi:hypothetical protein